MGIAAKDVDVAAELKSAVRLLGMPGAELDYVAALRALAEDDRYRLLIKGCREPLLPDEAQALEDVGVGFESGPASMDQALKSAGLLGHIRATALPIGLAARRLGVTDGRLRQRISEGDLLSIRGSDGRSHLIPAFQFTENGELPGLRKVLAAVRPGVKLLTIYGFFMTPQPDLEDEHGDAVTPVEWLMAGEDARVVAELASDI